MSPFFAIVHAAAQIGNHFASPTPGGTEHFEHLLLPLELGFLISA